MILIGVFAMAALIVFYFMNRSTRKWHVDHSERSERHRQYYDALMERRRRTATDHDKKEAEQ